MIHSVLDFEPHFGQGCHGVAARIELHAAEIELLAGHQLRLNETDDQAKLQ